MVSTPARTAAHRLTRAFTRSSIRKVAAVTACGVLAPLALGACGGSSNNSDSGGSGGSVTSLTVLDYYSDEPGRSQVGALLSSCGTTIGVAKVDHQSVPGPTLIQKVLQQASSKTLPDVLMLDNPDIQQIADTGALADLGQYGINGDGFAKGPIAAATGSDGKLYGLQPGANTLAIFYNKDVLSKAGVKPPTTWAELKSDAQKLTVGKQYGFAFNATADYEGAWQFLPPMWTNGGDETNLTSPQVAGALQLWKDLVDDGSASKSVVNWSQADVNDQFIAGKAAMMLNGPWQIPALDKAKINYGVVPFPVDTAGQTSVAPLGGEAWTVPVTGDQAKMKKAAELVKCMNSDAMQLKHAEEAGVVPTRLSLAGEFAKADPEMAGFIEPVANARARTGKLGAKWPDVAKTIYTGMQLVLTGQASPADAMSKAGAGS